MSKHIKQNGKIVEYRGKDGCKKCGSVVLFIHGVSNKICTTCGRLE